MKQYHLDTNVLIEVKNGAYGFSRAPTFWKLLKEKLLDRTILITRKVYEELVSGGDDLAIWILELKDEPCIINPDEIVQKEFQQIADYVIASYPLHQASEFLNGADPWVIAQAQVSEAIVVTHESLVADDSKKPKIPNICTQFRVAYTDLFRMMDDLEFKL